MSEEGNRNRGRISKALDTLAKLAAAGAIVAGAFIAHGYQSKMTATTLISHREEAESELRANMFSNLIGPIVGSQKEDEVIPPNRERLLVELLALNFNAHFECKPLLMHVDNRLATELDKDQVEEARESLRSIARRVISRQIAVLSNQGVKGDRTEIESLYFENPPKLEDISSQRDEYERKHKELKEYYSESGEHYAQFGEKISVLSPDKKHKLNIICESGDCFNETFDITLYTESGTPCKEPCKEKYDGISVSFTLTWFDFPLTDNTLLADGNRFALVLDAVDVNKSKCKAKTDASKNLAINKVALKLIWFPKVYFTPRERPINYSEFREKLGLQIDQDKSFLRKLVELR